MPDCNPLFLKETPFYRALHKCIPEQICSYWRVRGTSGRRVISGGPSGMIKSFMAALKKILDRFYREYNFTERMLLDPIEFPHRYKDPGDIEVSGFIASCLAYGKVGLFKDVVNRILSKMGKAPFDFVMNFSLKSQRKLFRGLKYRFNENEDIVCMIFLLHKAMKGHGSLEKAFKNFYGTDDKNTGDALSGLMSEFLMTDTSAVYGRNIRPAGLTQLFPSPANGSACKRPNLFLRWMIRDRDIDLGIWKDIPKN